jgi:hypothetical protein
VEHALPLDFGNNVEDSMGRVRFFSGTSPRARRRVPLRHRHPPVHGSGRLEHPECRGSGATQALGAHPIPLPDATVPVLLLGLFFWRTFPLSCSRHLFLLQLWEGGFAVLHPQQAEGSPLCPHGGFRVGARRSASW